MCGIAGFFSVNRTENELKKMTQSLNHRGPDANGTFFDSRKSDMSTGTNGRNITGKWVKTNCK